jgi:hypothetical protein
VRASISLVARAVGRQNLRLARADGRHHRAKKIEHPDIHRDDLARMEIAQKHREVGHRRRDRPLVVAIRAVEGLAGVRIGEAQTPQLRRRGGERACHAGQGDRPGDDREQQPAVHLHRWQRQDLNRPTLRAKP